MFTGYPVHTRVERHGNHRNRAAPRTASSLVFVSKGISNPDQTIEAGDVNISGVDFWHAVEFSRNGRFLRTAFQRALRALRFFRVSSLPDVFRSVFRSFIHPIPAGGISFELRSEAYQGFRCAQSGGFALSEGAHFAKRARLDSAVS